ncbi:hypothetical protein [Actinomadura gamaensis]|uniref:ATP-binding protein n=1 Tax=Actinomadura gamaensis TaxID=1763541 RepID=A0ABV9TVV5_9ACTN
MGQGKPINRADWPAEGPHRRLLEFLDEIHATRGLKSRGEITAAMALTSRTNVNAILRGHRLPADERQAHALAIALGGTPAQGRRAAVLYTRIRLPLGAGVGRSVGRSWAERVAGHEVWGRVPDEVTRSRAVALAEDLGALADEASGRLLDDPWLDVGAGLRFMSSVEALLRGPLRGLGDLSPAEAALIALVPLLHQTHLLRALARLRVVGPLELSSIKGPSAERRAFEVLLLEHPELTSRAQAPSLPDRENARAEIGWWLFHRWLARYPRLYNLPDVRSLLGTNEHPGGTSELLGGTSELLDAETVRGLLYALRLDVSELTAGERAKALRCESRTAAGEHIVREQLLAHVFAVASAMAIDLTRLPDVIVRHLGIPGALDLADLRGNVTSRAKWISGADVLHLSARCGHPAELEGLRGHADRMDTLLHAVRRAARAHPHLSPLAALPSRATADEVTARTDEEGRPLFRSVSRFRLDERRVQELLMGEQLYQDRSLAVRELYQNALDACRYREARIAHLRARGLWLDDWTGRIAFRQGTDENGRAFIECADNGIGMTAAVLTEVFAQAGTRFIDMPDFLDEAAEWESADPPVPFFPNSRFGIGVLSYFMLADEIEITTRPMGRRGDPQPTLRVSIFGPGHLFRIEHVAIERSPGTTVRLYLRPGERPVDCLDVLREWLHIAQFHTTVAVDGRPPGDWPAGELRRDGSDAADVIASWSEPGGGTVVWVRRGGGLLVDGLRMEPPSSHYDTGPRRSPHGVVVNLTGSRTPTRVSVDRRNVLSDVSADVEEMVRAAARTLVAPGAAPLTADWLFSVVQGSCRIADAVVTEAIAAGGRIEHAAGSWDASRTGCFLADAQLTWGSRRHAPWDAFAGRSRPMVLRTDLNDVPDAVVLWRVLAHDMAEELGLPGLDGAPEVLPALPSDAIVLGGGSHGRWLDDGLYADRWQLGEMSRAAEMTPAQLLRRAETLGAPEQARRKLADAAAEPSASPPADDLVISADPYPLSRLLVAVLSYGDDLDLLGDLNDLTGRNGRDGLTGRDGRHGLGGLDGRDGLGPAELEILRERERRAKEHRPGKRPVPTRYDQALGRRWIDLPALLRRRPVPLLALIVMAGLFDVGVERVRTVLGWAGAECDHRPPPAFEGVDLSRVASEVWQEMQRDGDITPAGLCRAAGTLGLPPSKLGEMVVACGITVPFPLPDDLCATDHRLLESYGAVAERLPSADRPLAYPPAVRAALDAGVNVGDAVRRLVAYGYAPPAHAIDAEPDGITRRMIAHGLFLGGVPGDLTAVSLGDLVRIQAEQGAEPAETAARLARFGFDVPDASGWRPDEHDVLILRSGIGANGPWIPRDRPVPLLHLVRAAWDTGRTVPQIADRLRVLGMTVRDLDETIKMALARVPRVAPVPS